MSLRNAGFVACLVGVLVMVLARFAHRLPPAFGVVGVAIIVVGWALFALSARRTRKGVGGRVSGVNGAPAGSSPTKALTPTPETRHP